MEENSAPKAKILNTAVTLFAEKGYRETSVRDISRKAEVNVSMISYYFGGKKGLMEEIIRQISEGFNSHIEQFDMEDQETLLAQFIDFLHFLEDNRPSVKILLAEMGNDDNYLLPAKAKIGEIQDTLVGWILRKNRKNVPIDRGIHIMTDIILGMIFADFVFDFSRFQTNIDKAESRAWREERIGFLIGMLQLVAGMNPGRMPFESLFDERGTS